MQINKFSTLADAFPEIASKIVRKTALDAEAAIKNRIQGNGQVRTGNMLNGIYHNTSDRSTYKAVQDALPELARPQDRFTAKVGAAAHYSLYQNYGTRYTPGRPFFEPGMADVQPGFEAAIAAFEDALRREL